MSIRNFWLFCCFVVLFLPVSAQEFVTLDWRELPAAQTLPVVTREFPLEDGFRSCDYQVEIEFPEYQNLDNVASAALQARLDSLRLSPDADGTFADGLSASPQITSRVKVSAHRGFLSIRLVPVVRREGSYQRLNSFKLSVKPVPKQERVEDTSVRNTAFSAAEASRKGDMASSSKPSLKECTTSLLASGRWAKVRVRNTGVFKLTNTELKKMGFSRPEKVRVFGYGGYLLSQRFDEHPAADLPEVPVLRLSDGVLFYARGTVSWHPDTRNSYFVRERNFYSDEAYYFLTDREDLPELETEVETSLQDISGNRLTTFNAYALYEKDAFSWANTGRELYEDYDYAAGNSRNYTLNLPGVVPGSAGWLTVLFAACSLEVPTSYTVSVDGALIGSAGLAAIPSENRYYTKATTAAVNTSWQGNPASEGVTVNVTHTRPSGTSGRLDYIALNYTRELVMNAPYLAFRSLASIGKETTFVLSGTAASTIVWDVTDPANIRRIEGIRADDGTYRFTIPAGNLREFVAVTPEADGFEAAEPAGSVPNQNLHALEATDMMIITPDRTDLAAQAERLAQAHREKDGLSITVVPASQIYNEFSSGTPDGTAYRRLMKMLYDRFPTDADRPKYLLFFGDCSFDNRMLTSSWKSFRQENYLLSYQSENSVEETASFVTDDYFGFLDDEEGDDLTSAMLDIGIGRFPVRTADEAKAAVDKTIAYMENKQAGPWKHTVCYVSDDGDDNTHVSQAELLASYTEQNYPSLLVNRIYADAFRRETSATGETYPEATKRLLQMFDKGMLVVNYTGHGSTSAWAAENLLTVGDIVKMSSPRFPLWITATCDFTRFDDIQTSAGEHAFLNAKGGAIALFTTSRVVYAARNSELNQAFLRHIFARHEGKRLRLGDIMRFSKCDEILANDKNKLNFVLIGDPALTLSYPDYQIQIDEFAGVNVAGEGVAVPQVKAGSKITVRGHILTPDGAPAEDFTGTVHPTVLDSKTQVTTLDNHGEGAYTYTERSKVLYSGSDSVRQGRFEFTFPVPLDINYSDEAGLLSLYALSADCVNEAGGYFDAFLVGGTSDDLSSDTSGPEMRLYLNTPDFESGGQTNHTPLFVAELEDRDGINTVGNGIGHDLSLCIDGSAVLTYNLNDYYVPTAGDYTRGQVYFSIPDLDEGKHTLSFRAWDVLNNSSTKTLEFEVVRGLHPELLSVGCLQSPARESTTFTLSHNRPGSVLAVRMSVYDFSGRELWTHLEQGISEGQTYYVEWDLCSNGGQRLAPGVYLYRASIVSDGSRESTKARKIIILSQ
ncbi:type IX secretion system sortase PorU [uncultured Bacteroides sp.]|uniref:type IX secretion system sortase PorU n=1 Tax=uncultured Bacteroides sp. TaxID=162156 RepID=UPI002635E23C|nr:type IX secretion system sortase PorU [uncultured Bacteroides sp.]